METFGDVVGYVEKVTAFLNKYSWLYSSKNTDVLVNNVCDQCPLDWVDYISKLGSDIGKLPYADGLHSKLSDILPELEQFAEEASSLSLCRKMLNVEQLIKHIDDVVDVTDSMFLRLNNQQLVMGRKIGAKKRYEVNCLAPEIDHLCKISKCRTIVDIGAGMGHLSQCLQDDYGYTVLAIEADIHHQRGESDLTYITTKLEDSLESFNLLQQAVNNFIEATPCYCYNCADSTTCSADRNACIKNICLMGLHCCGDLSVAMMKLYHHIPNIRSYFAISCCYHRMSTHNFPCSEIAKTYVTPSSAITSVPALRLASQQTRSHFRCRNLRDHDKYDRNVILRAVLQQYLSDNKLEIHKKHRKLVKVTETTSAAQFFTNLCSRVKFVTADGSESVQTHRVQDFVNAYERCSNKFAHIKAIVCLQNVIQGVLETFIMMDRVILFTTLAMETSGEERSSVIKKVKLIPVYDDLISPRNLALISIK